MSLESPKSNKMRYGIHGQKKSIFMFFSLSILWFKTCVTASMIPSHNLRYGIHGQKKIDFHVFFSLDSLIQNIRNSEPVTKPQSYRNVIRVEKKGSIFMFFFFLDSFIQNMCNSESATMPQSYRHVILDKKSRFWCFYSRFFDSKHA